MNRLKTLSATLLACINAASVAADEFADAMARAAPLDGRWSGVIKRFNPATGATTETDASFTCARNPSDELGFTIWSADRMTQTSYLGEGRYLRLRWNTAGRYMERTEYESAFVAGPDDEGDYTLVNMAWMTWPNGNSYEQRDTTTYEDGTLTLSLEVRPPGGEGPFKRLFTATYTRAEDAPRDGPVMTGRPITAEDYDNSDWQAIAMTAAADLLEEHYIYADKGALLAAYLRENLDSFADITDKSEFATALSEGLQGVVNDGHLRVNYAFAAREGRKEGVDAERPFDCRTTTIEHRWLKSNVGYIQIPHFRRNMESLLPNFEAAMRELAQANALILDLRGNCGGSDEILNEMMSYFFAEPTLLFVTEERGQDVSERWSLADVAGPRFLRRPVYILVNGRTSSAGESFTFALGPVTGRAIVVGARTAGLGHFGGLYSLGPEFRMFVPRGRPFDPETRLGFEVNGITPNIEVPQDEALKAALADFARR